MSLYSRLKKGRVIKKEGESLRYQVAARTIQQDIADIQSFLQNQEIETGEVQEVVYDKSKVGYVLQTKYQERLKAKEIMAASKILLESWVLMRNELFPIIQKLLGFCDDESEAKMTEDLLRNEMYHYVEQQHGKKLLDRLWELEQAVKTQRYIEIQYKKLKNQEVVIWKLKPVGIMFSEFYFYLTAYIEGINKEEYFQNPNDAFPTIYRVDRLETVRVLEEHFPIPYAERFEEGEFRKRIQFMYGGKLRKVKLKCAEQSLETVLDRLPTAKVVGKEENEYVVQAEVFGVGIEKWMREQESFVNIIKS